MYQITAHPDNGRGRLAASSAPNMNDLPEADFDGEAFTGADTEPVPERLLRVLVVDDAPDVTEMIALVMSYAGYQVSTAFSAIEAFDAARDGRFDAVISDIGMPEMNGYQLAEALRALPGYESTPLIAVTGFTMYDDRERARAAGFDGFLTKPINPSDLIEAVKRLCG
jgi:two-component system CheB/CheR fusion protein